MLVKHSLIFLTTTGLLVASTIDFGHHQILTQFAISQTPPAPSETGGIVYTLELRSPDGTNPTAAQVAQTQEMLRRRAEMLGVTLADINQVGAEQLQVKIATLGDLKTELKTLERQLFSPWRLTFRPQRLGTKTALSRALEERRTLELELDRLQTTTFPTAPDLSRGPRDRQQMLERRLAQVEAEISQFFLSPVLTGTDVREADLQPWSELGTAEVLVTFNPAGARRFQDITREIAGRDRALGIFLDQRLLNSPIVGVEYATTGITGGRAVVSGMMKPADARQIVRQINLARYPLPLNVTIQTVQTLQNVKTHAEWVVLKM